MKQFSNLKRAFLPCLFVLLTLPAWGQMQPVTKNFRKTPLKNVLKEVEAQTGLSIMYDTRELNLERPVTASFDRTPVSQVLREVLDRTVQYSIKDKMIVIYKASATPPPAAGTGKTLTGTVLDETGAPMVGAAVATPDGRRGTVTDSNGRYSLTLGAGDALISVSYLGYVTRQIVIGDRTEVDVNLVPDAKNTINEVVVIGYGAVKKSDLTGSVSNVKMSDIRDVPNTSVDQALQGRIAGVDIMSTSGAPGATTSIRVRGTRSISASNEPLIVVDGVIDAVSDLNDINSADIEQISVLKDASSTAIYGSRGANGVIIVTTRQGVTSKPSVTAKAEFGVSKLARDLDLMDAQEFVRYLNDRNYFSSRDPQRPPRFDPSEYGRGTDWIDEITRTALYQNYNLSVSGRSQKSSYFAALGGNDTQGIVDGSGFRRITARLNLSYDFAKWLTVGFKGSYTFRDENPNRATIGGANIWDGAVYLAPTMGPKDYINPLYENGVRIDTPRAKIDCNENESERMTNTDVLEFTIKPVRGLIIKSELLYGLPASRLPVLAQLSAEAHRGRRGRCLPLRGRRTPPDFGKYGLLFEEIRLGALFRCDGGLLGHARNGQLFLAEGRRVAHRRPEVEQHEQHRQQGELQRFDQLEQSRAGVGAHAPELQLQEPLLLHLHGALRRVVELRREQQMGFLPFGGRQVERQEREFSQAGALAR